MKTIMNAIEMPDRLAEDLIMLIRQNDGKLAKHRRERNPINKMTDEEITLVEGVVADAFNDEDLN